MSAAAPSREWIYAELTKIVRQVLDDDTLEITDATTADDVEHWDSINHIQLIVAAEKKFNVRFKIAEVTAFKNIGELVDAIQQRLSK
jgi:acyl carrier protein